MLIMVGKGIRGGICHSIYRYAKANWDVNNLYGWAMLQMLPVNNFEWIEDTSQFNEDFIKDYNEESHQRSCVTFTMIYHFYLKE